MRHFLFFSAFLFVSFTYGQNYSIKNRLNTKLSVSCNRTNEWGNDYFAELDRPLHPIRFRFNVRAECNYGVTNWLELGGYLGYIRYENTYYSYWRHQNFINCGNGEYAWVPKDVGDKSFRVAFAPTFGINANVHLLPFFVKNKDCRWEWYVTAKYGGAYLINHMPFRSTGISVVSTSSKVQSSDINCSGKRYRNIFGAGMGGGVYFKNVFGLYAEVMAGQYSYFQEIVKSPYTIRIGCELKFTPKKKGKSKENTTPEHIEIQIE